MDDLIRAIADIIRAAAWPSVAVFGAIYFRREIGDLAKRLRKGGGAEFDPLPQSTTAPPNPLAPVPSSSITSISTVASESLEALPKTPAIAAHERALVEFPALKNVPSGAERERVLLRMLARAVLVAQFEQAEGAIWASQLELLTYLNSTRQGESLPQLKSLFYDKAASQYPVAYQNYSFDGWLSFLQRYLLVTLAGGLATITDEGIEYLQWRVQQAKPPKVYG